MRVKYDKIDIIDRIRFIKVPTKKGLKGRQEINPDGIFAYSVIGDTTLYLETYITAFAE